MLNRLLLVLACNLGAFLPFLSAQTLGIAYQNPDQLAVCSADTFRVSIQNNSGAVLDSIFLTLNQPAGLEYVPGSVAGALEGNVANPGKPVFLIKNLAPGATASVLVLLTASCDLTAAINSGQLFSLQLNARSGAVQENVTTAAFQIQTSLLVITKIDSDSFSAPSGTTVKRNIHIQNTRLGPVKYLFLHDTLVSPVNPPLLGIHIAGAVAEQAAPPVYSASFDGSIFKNFGDGDELLEFGETVILQEIIDLPPCIDSMPTVRSYIDVGWSCSAGAASCQSDTAYADIVILQAPEPLMLTLDGRYPLGWDHCAQIPSNGALQLYNTSTVTGKNIFMSLTTIPVSTNTGIDPNSLRALYHGVETPIQPSLVDTILLADCGVTYAKAVSFYIPELAGLDSVEVLFQTYYCSESCEPPTPVYFGTFYAGGTCDGAYSNVKIAQREVDNLLADVYYDLGECLQDGQTYNFNYVMQCERLLADSGYLWLNLDLPRGLFWSDNCPPKLGGKSPKIFTIDSVFTTHPVQRVRMAFELPLKSDSLSMPFCLRSTCIDDAVFVPQSDLSGPDSNGIFTISHPNTGDHCGHCGFPVETKAILSRYLDSNLDCAWPKCDEFRLRTACERSDCGSGTPPSDSCPNLRERHTALRVNYGLPDNNDDRTADGLGTPDLTKIRRDRLLSGDTLQAVLSTKILCGDSLQQFFYQLFTETIRSDYGYGGALDTFEIGPSLAPSVKNARKFMANRDSFQVIQANFVVWDSSSNTTYTCPIAATPGGTNHLYGLVTPMNTKPAPPQDEIASMSYAFAPDLAQLGAAGCLPPGLLLESGDSVALQVSYKLAFNFVPFSKQHRPPLVNFEMGFNANGPEDIYNYRRYDTLMFQYTGVWDSLSHPQYGIKACEPSAQALPFSYNARVARENLFPYEVRPLNRIAGYTLTVPPFAALQSAKLEFLNLQENTPRLQNFNLPYSIQNNLLDIDFGPAYANPPDEGYSLRTQVVFAPNCRFAFPAHSGQEVVIDWTGCIRRPDPDTIRTENFVGYLANSPRDTMTTDELVIEFPTPAEGATVFIRNKAPIAALNYFVEVINPEGGLVNIQMQRVNPPGSILQPVNGIIQLGTFPSLGNQAWAVNATNNSCDPQHLILVYGWDCQPHTQPGTDACDTDTLTFLFKPQKPEIELNLLQMPSQAPLCDTSDYIVFEVSNADLGYAYRPFASIELPAGFHFVPGSAGLAYPAGGSFGPLADPAANGNLLEWDLAALQQLLGTNGVPGVNLSPQNALQIRFRVVADCGVVSNTQLVFGARAEWSCGKPTNTLRKAGNPLPVEGLVPGYTAQIGINPVGNSGPLTCGTERTLAISVLLSGPAQPGDSLYVLLPPGFTYKTGSYQPGANAPAGPPQIAGDVLQWPVPAGLPANTQIAFTFSVYSGSGHNCNGAVLRVQTRQRATAFCPVISTDCSVYVATGEAVYTFPAANPDVKILSATFGTQPNGQTNITLEVQNNSPFDVSAPVIRPFVDRDHNGVISAADTALFVTAFTGIIPAGGTQTLVWNIPNNQLSSWNLCELIFLMAGLENCDCDDVAFTLDNSVVEHPAQSLCVGQSVPVGVPAEAGRSYLWSGAASLPCDTCSQFQFVAVTPGQFALTLTEQNGACATEHHFSVQVDAVPTLLTNDTSICSGQSIHLPTGASATWQWSGPGVGSDITDPLKVQPAATSVYHVMATSAAGCMLTDSLRVTVRRADTTDLGIQRTCAGTPVDVFGTLTDVAGQYRDTLANATGCDSLLLLRLEVVPNTEETRGLCPNDTLVVFGQVVYGPGSFAQTVTSSLGCDSTHTVIVTGLPAPDLPDPDTFYLEIGKAVQLPSPGLFSTYFWAPFDSLSCVDCPSPLASPIDTMDYTVTVYTADGCRGELVYRVVPLPPCDPARIRVPNTFTPNGDGNNDTFTFVPYEGTEIIERLRIYNRWGQKIYDAGGPTAAWDGTSDGKPAPVDSYVWILEIGCSGGGKVVLKGDVALVR